MSRKSDRRSKPGPSSQTSRFDQVARNSPAFASIAAKSKGKSNTLALPMPSPKTKAKAGGFPQPLSLRGVIRAGGKPLERHRCGMNDFGATLPSFPQRESTRAPVEWGG